MACLQELSGVPVALEVSEGENTVHAASDSSPSRSGSASAEEAATRLQALYRGFAVRRRLQAQADGRAAAAAHGEQAAAWFQALHRVATTRTQSIEQHSAIQTIAAGTASSKEDGAGEQHEEGATKLEEAAATKLEEDVATKLEEDAATELDEDSATKLEEDVAEDSAATKLGEDAASELDEDSATKLEEDVAATLEEDVAATKLEEDAATELDEDAATKLEGDVVTTPEEHSATKLEEDAATKLEDAATRIQAFRRGSAARRRLQRQHTMVFAAAAGEEDSEECSGEVFSALEEEGREEGCAEGSEESSRPHRNEFLGRATTEWAPEEERSQVVEAEVVGSTNSQEAEVVAQVGSNEALVVASPSGENTSGPVAAAAEEAAEASMADSMDEFEESEVDSGEPVVELARVDVGVTEEPTPKLGTEAFAMSGALEASSKLEPEAPEEADSGDDPFEDSTEAPGEEQLATLGSGVELVAGEADWADDALEEDQAVESAASGHQDEHEGTGCRDDAFEESGCRDDTFEESTETHGNEFSEPADAEEDYGDDFEDDAFEEDEEEEDDEEDTSCTEAS